ncbi:hypothetical protein RV12_GL002279 [Enterococcus quebecensis]|nr:hypothetical protein RV12_GL002279 [Enterococcus quebecensis]
MYENIEKQKTWAIEKICVIMKMKSYERSICRFCLKIMLFFSKKEELILSSKLK